MRDLAELGDERRVQLRPAVAVQIRPDGRVSIQVTPPLRVGEPRALGFHDDQGFARDPFAHLREGMPHIFPVVFRSVAHFGRGNVWSLGGSVQYAVRRVPPRGRLTARKHATTP